MTLCSATLMAEETFFNQITLESKSVLSVGTETHGLIKPADLLMQDVKGLSLDHKGHIIIEIRTDNVLDVELKNGSILDWATTSQKLRHMNDMLSGSLEKSSSGEGTRGGGG